MEADAINHHLSCYHLALAASLVGCTKAVINIVISDTNNKIVANYLEAHKKSITCIDASMECIVLNASRRHYEKCRCGTGCDCHQTSDEMFKFQDWKGCAHFDWEFVNGLKHLGQDDIVQAYNSFITCALTFCLWRIQCWLWYSTKVYIGRWSQITNSSSKWYAFIWTFLPNHTKRPLPKMFVIRLGLFLEENGLKSVKQLGLWAKTATRQTRICYDS